MYIYIYIYICVHVSFVALSASFAKHPYKFLFEAVAYMDT